MNAPIIEIGHFSILAVEYETGILLNKQFKRLNISFDNNNVYWIFKDRFSALEFMKERIGTNNSLEFSLFNANGDFISIYNKETNI